MSCSGAEIRNLPGALSVCGVPSGGRACPGRGSGQRRAARGRGSRSGRPSASAARPAHRLLRRPLGRGDERDGDGASAPRDRVRIGCRVGGGLGQLGVLIDDDDQRGHRWLTAPRRAGRSRPGSSARASRMATASASSARASAGVVASRSMHDAHGPSSMPRLRSIAQITTSGQAVRLPIRTFRPAALA